MGMNGLPGGGPWDIVETCRAKNHNSLAAAKGGGANRGLPLCTCPRAKDLRRIDAQVHRQAKRRRTIEGHVITGNLRHLVEHMPEPVKVDPPTLKGLVCTTERARNIMMTAFDSRLNAQGEHEREQAKTICHGCPVRNVCRAYVLENESPAGSWGGVWAGLDPWNRAGYTLVFAGRSMGAIKTGVPR